MIHLVLAALALVAGAAAASAQTNPVAPAPTSIAFLSRADFHLAAEHLSGEDGRFVWDADFGGALDLVDYSAGRLTFIANYQVVLGDEFRAFDANQGNYILAGQASARLPAVEIAGVFYHQSRHLSDRPKRVAVDWNMVGVQVRADRRIRSVRIDGTADVRGVVQKTFVDYRWEFDGRLRSAVPVGAGFSLVGAGAVRWLGVDGSAARGTQRGFRAEGAVRFDGGAAAVELFVAAERRIDPYPLEHTTATWATAGFRLVSR